MQGYLEGGKRLIRRALTWGERLTLTGWYLNRIDLRTCGKVGDTATRDRIIIFLLDR